MCHDETDADKPSSGTMGLGYGTFHIGSVRRELESRLQKLKMEMDMVMTALSLCTEEAEKGVQLQRILNQLPKRM